MYGFRTCETSGRCPPRPYSTGCFTPHPLSAVRCSLHPKPVRGGGKESKRGWGPRAPSPSIITSRPRETPRPQRGAARGAAEGPSLRSSRGWQALPCRGLLRSAAECAAKGGFVRVGDRGGIKTACCRPCAGFDGLTWFRTYSREGTGGATCSLARMASKAAIATSIMPRSGSWVVMRCRARLGATRGRAQGWAIHLAVSRMYS